MGKWLLVCLIPLLFAQNSYAPKLPRCVRTVIGWTGYDLGFSLGERVIGAKVGSGEGVVLLEAIEPYGIPVGAAEGACLPPDGEYPGSEISPGEREFTVVFRHSQGERPADSQPLLHAKDLADRMIALSRVGFEESTREASPTLEMLHFYFQSIIKTHISRSLAASLVGERNRFYSQWRELVDINAGAVMGLPSLYNMVDSVRGYDGRGSAKEALKKAIAIRWAEWGQLQVLPNRVPFEFHLVTQDGIRISFSGEFDILGEALFESGTFGGPVDYKALPGRLGGRHPINIRVKGAPDQAITVNGISYQVQQVMLGN